MIETCQQIGIKQVIRLEWMTKTVDFLLAGLDEKSIRRELHEFLAERKGSGLQEGRGHASRTQVVNMLMKTWVTPPARLLGHRDDALKIAGELCAKNRIYLHWAVISAAYPFWFNVAKQCGRLLKLQDKVSQPQIFSRLRETYGDRETVLRYARYTIRSFVAWGVLVDSPEKGCYAPSTKIAVKTPAEASLLFEAALLASPGQKAALSQLSETPGLFPFELPSVTGTQLAEVNQRLSVMRYGLDEEMLSV